jgi:diguanylate cyclase (GGDEF)-like protein
VLLGNQRIALLIAFTFVFLFAGIMLALGIVSARAKVQASGYFLLAAMAAMVGAALTALSVWGFIPFSPWTFRAVDIGMLLDATLLALALTYQFRLGQSERQRAELLARLDPLTGLNNRRAFYDITAPLWNVALRHNQKLSVILLDIDHFKHLNDTHGHAFGDVVLNAVARILEKSIRSQDVAARWGGEEFILLLPQTDVDEATLIADRLRNTIAGTTLRIDDAEIAITVSLGVAQLDTQHHSLDDLISSADHYLYESKDKGRNRVSRAPVEVEQGRDIG